ncbi:enoyl-CoA hydratase-related protein [Thalassobius sp. S69A]|uniref:enoyl-CoA hydratase-related protein n=1 Tax=unclassified Thalassovita TaxID=2619711 RepID=UPI000C106C8D|nr:enoyl-CoA hydratase [Paracoccaceae bacterium]MBT26490.1 enoyl-CoA hydratase [Paracoccaceae bacterium]
MQRFETIRYDLKDRVAVITLNRPEVLNALSRRMRSELAAAIRQGHADPDCRAIVLTGAGQRAFCVGMDMKAPPAPAGTPAPDCPMQALAACDCPVIAAINGFAITGGLELALGCDLILAADTASFTDTHARIGALPGWGLSQRLSRRIGLPRAQQMHLTAARIDAQTALNWGLAQQVTPLPDLLPAATSLAQEMAQHDPAIIAELKRLARQGHEMPLQDALTLEAQAAAAWRDRPA